MFNKKLKKENTRLEGKIIILTKEGNNFVNEISEKNTLIKHLKQEIQSRKTELETKNWKMRDLEKTVNKVGYWLSSMLDIKASTQIISTSNGFNILISPARFSEYKFPEMKFIYYDSGSNSRDRIEISLGPNPVFNDIFMKQLASVFTNKNEITRWEDSITVYGGIKNGSKIISGHLASILKYNDFISNIKVAKKPS